MNKPITPAVIFRNLGKDLHNGLYATPPDIRSAYDQALMIANASDNPSAVLTAVQIVVNAIAAELMDSNK